MNMEMTEERVSTIKQDIMTTYLRSILILSIVFLILEISVQNIAPALYNSAINMGGIIFIALFFGVALYFEMKFRKVDNTRLNKYIADRSRISSILVILFMAVDYVIFLLNNQSYTVSLGMISLQISFDIVLYLIIIVYAMMTLYLASNTRLD